jgi:hypothetical protein
VSALTVHVCCPTQSIWTVETLVVALQLLTAYEPHAPVGVPKLAKSIVEIV